MVLDPASLDLPIPGQRSLSVTGVTMDVLPEQQFAMLRELVPGIRRVGVLFDPAVSGPDVRRAQSAARAAGLELLTQPVRGEADVLAAARLLAPRVDALWTVADSTVLTAANARAIVLFALRARKPLFAMSEGYVRTGALAALAADPREVGARAGQLAARVLAGTATRELAAEPPPQLRLFINRASAEHLGLSLPPEMLARADKVYPEP
jgi:putative ABC transport system substrate-binding protein